MQRGDVSTEPTQSAKMTDAKTPNWNYGAVIQNDPLKYK